MTIRLRAQKEQQFQAKSKIGTWLTTMDVRLFFLLIFVYHLLVIFQGLDFNDEGFHLAFYQQIFSDPESVQYAFWGWLTGMIGGIFMKLFPYLGMFGIRLLGSIISTLTIILAYNLLKRYLDKVYLMVGLVMLSLFINEDAKNLYYNNLSAFLYFVVAYCIFHGMTKNKNWLLAFGGFFVGANIFSRIPNVLGVSLFLPIVYYGYLLKLSTKKILTKSLIFFAGTMLACLTLVGIMVWLHQFKFFTGSIQMIFSPSRGSKDDGLNGAYGFTRLLTNNIVDYLRSLRFVLIIGVFGFLLGYVNQLALKSPGPWRSLIRIINYGLLLASLVLITNGWFTRFRLMEFFVGTSLLSAIVLIEKKINPGQKLLALIGLLITLIHPFGSSEGISTVVVYSMWISFPMALDYVSKFLWINLKLETDTNARPTHIFTILSLNRISAFRNSIICIFTVASLYNVVRYPYLCDKHSRWEMRYSVDNQFMWGVFTSKGRARDLDELLKASAKYVKPADTVLAYDCMPMYHFMTQTRSYVRNPCIWFYTTDMFQKELTLAEASKNHLPVIVRQLIKTTGEGSAWPEIRPQTDYLQFPRNQGKNKILNEFIQRHHYSEVWHNDDFAILVPPN